MIESLKHFILSGVSAASCMWIVAIAANELNADLTSKQMIMIFAVMMAARGFRSLSVKQATLDAIDSIIIAICATFFVWIV